MSTIVSKVLADHVRSELLVALMVAEPLPPEPQKSPDIFLISSVLVASLFLTHSYIRNYGHS